MSSVTASWRQSIVNLSDQNQPHSPYTYQGLRGINWRSSSHNLYFWPIKDLENQNFLFTHDNIRFWNETFSANNMSTNHWFVPSCTSSSRSNYSRHDERRCYCLIDFQAIKTYRRSGSLKFAVLWGKIFR